MVAKRFRIASTGRQQGTATCSVDLEGDDRLLSMPGLPDGGLLPPVFDGGLSGPSGRCPSQGFWTMRVTPPLGASAGPSRSVCARDARRYGGTLRTGEGLDRGENGLKRVYATRDSDN
jgi:hypothetical protein